MRSYLLVGCSSLVISACGGGDKKPVAKPVAKPITPVVKKETEEDRAAKRLAEAQKIIPEGSTCLPPSLKDDASAPKLELAASGTDALLCAMDQDPDRRLGPVGCWKIDLTSGGLAYQAPQPLPGHGFAVKLDEGCARGYCLPKDAKGDADTAMIAWEAEGKKVAVLAGDDVHLFDADSKSHESSFSIRGEKGAQHPAVALYFVSGTIVVEGKNGPVGNAYVFKADGTAVGPINALGGKDERAVSTHKGSISILDKERIGVAERGMETMTVYSIADGKRTKIVRNSKKAACKPAEADAFWQDGEKVSDKCKGSIEALSGHLMGATAVAGAKNFLVLLRGDRLGELGVLDAKTLQEKKAIKLAWCSGEGGAEGGAADAKEASAGAKASTRGATSDPEEGGE